MAPQFSRYKFWWIMNIKFLFPNIFMNPIELENILNLYFVCLDQNLKPSNDYNKEESGFDAQ